MDECDLSPQMNSPGPENIHVGPGDKANLTVCIVFQWEGKYISCSITSGTFLWYMYSL